MTPEHLCLDCGAALPADAPRGLCPQCLMGAALSGPGSGANGTTGEHESPEAGVLATIAETIGPVPQVLLRDTTPGEAPGPIVTPVSLAAGGSIRYRIDGEIARGGMGAVLKGRDPDLGRDVALKVLRDDYRDDATMVRRFVEEAQIGGQLQHPGIVPIYELGTLADCRPFFAMKLVKGLTLAALLAQRPDPTSELPRHLAIFEAVCQTMAYAHARGVIHRDLKPSNVMVGSFGEVQVMDWGVAKVLPQGGVVDDANAGKIGDDTVIATARSGSDAEEAALSRAGSVLGTPSYMAPEQARGEVDRVDQRADVFALGSILCEILTGAPAFIGRSSAAILRKAALGDTGEAFKGLDACGADPELIGLAQDCLAREREDRPHDAGVVSGRMTAYLAGVQERLRQAELAHAAEVARTQEAQATAAQERKVREEAQARAVAEVRTRRLTGALAATVLLALLTGGGGWLWVKAERDARQARVARDINSALNQATALRTQASSAAIGSAVLFAQAREQVQRALALVENGPADALLVAEVRRMEADLDQEEPDRRLMAALDQALLKQAETVSTNRFATERALPVFRAALRAYGLPVGEGDPKAAAARIRSRPAAVREAIVTALDEWDELAGDPSLDITEPHRPWLQTVLAAAEPDSAWRRQVRAARVERDPATRRAALEKLAASANVTDLPARALTRLARKLEPAPSVALLRRAQWQYPADIWVNNNLGVALLGVTPPERHEAVRFLTVAAALRPDSPGCLFNLGIALRTNRQLDEAIACFRKAIELDPKYAMAHRQLGLALQDQGQLDEAIASYRKAMKLDPESAWDHYRLGDMLKANGQLDEAIALYRNVVKVDPTNAHARGDLGQALQAKGQLGEAVACYRKAIELDPKDARNYYNLAEALKANGQLNEAIASYRKAVEVDPKSGVVLMVSLALQNLGRRDEAIAVHRKAVEVDPTNASAHGDLGDALSANGLMDEAITSYRKAIELDPKNASARLALGRVLKDMDQVDQAIALYRKAVEADPENASARITLGDALKACGQMDEAVASYRKALEVDPQSATVHTSVSRALQAMGRLDEAVACQRKAAELDPKSAETHVALGSVLLAADHVDDAITSYRKAIVLDAISVSAHLGLASALKRKGHLDEAIASCRKAIELAPASAFERYFLGEMLKDTGKLDEAIASFREAIDLEPKNTPAETQLAKAQRLAAARDRLPALQDGSYTPASNEERLDLAEWCRIRKLHHTAARLYAEAFATDPARGDNLEAWHGYNAARSAALAAVGKAEDVATLDDVERARLRKQAVDWLRANLPLRTKQLHTVPPASRASVMRRWQQDPDLAAVRDPDALAQLPEGERKACEALWAEVQALVDRAQKNAR
jgi:serine/threonine-protein kinase